MLLSALFKTRQLIKTQMTDDHSPDHTQDSDVSSNELDGVIHANKSLFDKLNQLPEIEALSSISIEEEEAEEKVPIVPVAAMRVVSAAFSLRGQLRIQLPSRIDNDSENPISCPTAVSDLERVRHVLLEFCFLFVI